MPANFEVKNLLNSNYEKNLAEEFYPILKNVCNKFMEKIFENEIDSKGQWYFKKMGQLMSIGFLAFRKFRQYICIEQKEFYLMISSLQKYGRMFHKKANFNAFKIMLECFAAISKILIKEQHELFRRMIETKFDTIIKE